MVKVDNSGAFGALLTDLQKTFDCLSHKPVSAKFDAYGFRISSLIRLIYYYLSNKKQRKNMNYIYSSSKKWLYHVRKGFNPWANTL